MDEIKTSGALNRPSQIQRQRPDFNITEGEPSAKSNQKHKSDNGFNWWKTIVIVTVIILLVVLILYMCCYNATAETSRFLTEFNVFQILGKGSFGVVFEAKNKLDGSKYAVKRITVDSNKESLDRALREVKALANCKHANIVGYNHAWIENHYLYIQMELCQKQTLKDWVLVCKADSRLQYVKYIFKQIVSALEHIHKKGLIHRDLKPANILISLNHQIKIGDFGLATVTTSTPTSIKNLPLPSRRTQQVGTPLYMSPEQLEGREYDYKVDIFSLGLIFFELHVDFGTVREQMYILNQIRKLQFPKDFCDRFEVETNLCRAMLAAEPNDRPTASTILDSIGGDVGFATNNDTQYRLPSSLESVRFNFSTYFKPVYQ